MKKERKERKERRKGDNRMYKKEQRKRRAESDTRKTERKKNISVLEQIVCCVFLVVAVCVTSIKSPIKTLKSSKTLNKNNLQSVKYNRMEHVKHDEIIDFQFIHM